MASFVAHAMISSKDIRGAVVSVVILQEMVDSFSDVINNFDIVEVDGRERAMSMTIGIATKKVEKENKFVLVEKGFQVGIVVRPIKKALELIKRPLVQKGGIYTQRKRQQTLHSTPVHTQKTAHYI